MVCNLQCKVVKPAKVEHNIEYVSKLLSIFENTVRKGYGELLNIEDSDRVRKVGGGRKSELGDSDLMMVLDELIKDVTAGLKNAVCAAMNDSNV